MQTTIDIFCDIIDNFGDIGVVYRLSKELALSGYKVRIFVNKFDEVSKIIENFDKKLKYQIINKVEFYDFNDFEIDCAGKVIIEAFAVELPDEYLNKITENTKLIINLEYLSAESWVEEYHLKKSFFSKAWVEKYFYLPGFTDKTGGVILDSTYLDLINRVKKNKQKIFEDFFKDININLVYENDVYYINVFTYKWDFEKFINILQTSDKKFKIFLLDEKIKVDKWVFDNIEIIKIPYISQEKFDILLNLADFNFVRGEESFVRGILTEKPFIWNIYPQEEDIHLEKLEAFLNIIEPFLELEYFSKYKEITINLNKNIEFGNDFLEIFEKNDIGFKKFKEYLCGDCNLVEKLLNFIKGKTNQNLGGNLNEISTRN